METIASTSDENISEERMVATPTSPVAKPAATAPVQRELTEGGQTREQTEEIEEAESSTTDEVVDLDKSTETIPAYTASSSNETKGTVPAQTTQPTQHSLQRMPATRDR